MASFSPPSFWAPATVILTVGFCGGALLLILAGCCAEMRFLCLVAEAPSSATSTRSIRRSALWSLWPPSEPCASLLISPAPSIRSHPREETSPHQRRRRHRHRHRLPRRPHQCRALVRRHQPPPSGRPRAALLGPPRRRRRGRRPLHTRPPEPQRHHRRPLHGVLQVITAACLLQHPSLSTASSMSVPATALPWCLSPPLTTMLASIYFAPTSHTSKQSILTSESLLLHHSRLEVTVQKLILRQGLHNMPRIYAKVDQFFATLIWIDNHSDKSCWNWRSGSSPIVVTTIVADTQIRRWFACAHMLEPGEAFNKSTAQCSPSSRARPVRQSKGPPAVLSVCRDEDPWCYTRGFPMVFAIAPKRPRRQHQTLVTIAHSESFADLILLYLSHGIQKQRNRLCATLTSFDVHVSHGCYLVARQLHKCNLGGFYLGSVLCFI